MIETKETKKLNTIASFACIGSRVLYFISVISAVIFLRKSGLDWGKSIFLPLLGISVIYYGLRTIISHTVEQNYYIFIKYALALSGLVFSVLWLISYIEFSSLTTISPDLRNDYMENALLEPCYFQ
jgi:hypothetical protein